MIYKCEKDEALEILREKSISDRVGIVAEGMIYQPWIVRQKEHKMLFFFWPDSDGVVEMHIACPSKSIIKSRDLAREAILYVLSFYAKKIVTNCPKGKISNMAEKIGMKFVKTERNKMYYEVSLWELEQL